MCCSTLWWHSVQQVLFLSLPFLLSLYRDFLRDFLQNFFFYGVDLTYFVVKILQRDYQSCILVSPLRTLTAFTPLALYSFQCYFSVQFKSIFQLLFLWEWLYEVQLEEFSPCPSLSASHPMWSRSVADIKQENMQKIQVTNGCCQACEELMLGCVGFSPELEPCKVCNLFGGEIIQNILNFSLLEHPVFVSLAGFTHWELSAIICFHFTVF